MKFSCKYTIAILEFFLQELRTPKMGQQKEILSPMASLQKQSITSILAPGAPHQLLQVSHLSLPSSVKTKKQHENLEAELKLRSRVKTQEQSENLGAKCKTWRSKVKTQEQSERKKNYLKDYGMQLRVEMLHQHMQYLLVAI